MIYSDVYWDGYSKVRNSVPNIDKLKNKKVLITGSTGMICSAIVDLLFYLNKKKGLNVTLYLAGRRKYRVINRFNIFKEGEDYFFVAYDATKELHLDIEVDYIIHGASNANPSLYTKEPVDTLLSNVIGLNSLLDLSVKTNVQRLLYISSSEVYGRKESSEPYKEDDYGFVDILNPRACYPSGKRASETLCSAYSEQYGIETVIVRPGHIYGPTITRTDSRASAQFTWDVVDGHDIVMKSAGNQLRSYCYTLDCASAILTVLLNGESKNAYNISNKNSIVSIRSLAEELANCSSKKIIFENPTDVEQKGYNLMDNSSLTSDKLEALGWKASFDLHEGIKHTIDTLKNI